MLDIAIQYFASEAYNLYLPALAVFLFVCCFLFGFGFVGFFRLGFTTLYILVNSILS